MAKHRILGLAVLCSMVIAFPAAAGEPAKLFNGKDLAGWGFFLDDPGKKMEDVWSVEDGVLVCKGEPMGYLSTANGVQVNEATGLKVAPGKIGFQSEGGEIHFRTIELTPIE